jgi:hypothetical protein
MQTNCGAWALQDQFTAGNPSGGGFKFDFSQPISHLRLRIIEIDAGEYIQIKINGAPYPLSPSEISPISSGLGITCNSNYANDVSTGDLTSSVNISAAQIDLTGFPFAVNDVEIIQTQASGNSGSLYQLFFVNDTCNQFTPQASTTNPCEGANLTLSSTTVPNATYTWYKVGNLNPISTQQTFTIPNASLSDAGLYTVIATYGACNRSSSVTANVIARPVASGTTSDAPKCPGATINLSTDNVPGATYSWTGPGFSSTQEDPSIPNIQFNQQGDYIVTLFKNGCISLPDTTTVTLNSAVTPPDVDISDTVCPGTTLTVNINNPSNVIYHWIGPSYSNSTASTFINISNIDFGKAGKYYVSAEDGSGCLSFPDSIDVVVKILTPTPDADSAITACPGTTLQLNASTIPNATYAWTGPSFSSFSQNPAIPNVNYPQAGKYFVTATVNGCQSAPDSTIVNVEITTPTPDADSQIIVCPNTNLNLKASTIAGATYLWKGPSYTSTLQNPTVPTIGYGQAGIYYVTAKVNGCVSRPDTTIVTVDITTPTPDADSEIIVCPNTTLNLKASDITGATYQWTGPSYTSGLQNPSITAVTTQHAGYYYVKATVDGCESRADSTRVKVEITTPTPNATSNAPLCKGHQLNLGTDVITNATYSWKGPGGFTFNGQNPVVESTDTKDTGLYIVTADVDGCVSLPDTIYVGLKPQPDIISVHSNQPAICEGDSLTLIAKGLIHTPDVVYKWTGPNGFESEPSHVVGIGNVSMKEHGKYLVHAELDGCISEPKSVDVAVKVRPDKPTTSSNSPAPDRPKNVGDPVELYGDSGLPNTTYSWTGPLGFASQQQNPVIPYATKLIEGWYYLTITFGGCTSRDSTYVMIVPKTYYTIFPNPNEGNFTLKAGLIYDQEVPIEITNIMGQVVHTDKAEVKGKLLLKTFSLGGNLSNGVYFLRLSSKEEKWDIRFVISR